MVAFCTAFAQFSNNDWAVLHLGDDLGAAPTVAASGYAAYECAIAVARLLRGRVILIIGEPAVLVGGALLASLGIVVPARPAGCPVAWCSPSSATSRSGWALRTCSR